MWFGVRPSEEKKEVVVERIRSGKQWAVRCKM